MILLYCRGYKHTKRCKIMSLPNDSYYQINDEIEIKASANFIPVRV